VHNFVDYVENLIENFVDELEITWTSTTPERLIHSRNHPSQIEGEEVIENEDRNEESAPVTSPLIEIKDANLRRRNK
jgi:hypothetical protein